MYFLLLGLLLTAADLPPATEESSSSPSKAPLPLNIVLDADGKPISIPTETQSALELSPPEYLNPSPSQRKQISEKPVKSSRNKPKKLNRKQQLANRTSVANDPFCRWLDQRLKQLEQAKAQTYGHHKQEQKLRMQEWRCLKCGAEGPQTGDHDKCQAR